MARITNAVLFTVLRSLNRATNSPVNSPNEIGCFHFCQAYGGWQLHRTVNTSGGIRAITGGFVSKGEMYNTISNMLTGIELAKATQKEES